MTKYHPLTRRFIKSMLVLAKQNYRRSNADCWEKTRYIQIVLFIVCYTKSEYMAPLDFHFRQSDAAMKLRYKQIGFGEFKSTMDANWQIE